MRIITAVFYIGDLGLLTEKAPEGNAAIHCCREWLLTQEGENRSAVFAKAICSKPIARKSSLKALHFSVSIRGNDSPNTNIP